MKKFYSEIISTFLRYLAKLILTLLSSMKKTCLSVFYSSVFDDFVNKVKSFFCRFNFYSVQQYIFYLNYQL